jgi:hypothetical protein
MAEPGSPATLLIVGGGDAALESLAAPEPDSVHAER